MVDIGGSKTNDKKARTSSALVPLRKEFKTELLERKQAEDLRKKGPNSEHGDNTILEYSQ